MYPTPYRFVIGHSFGFRHSSFPHLLLYHHSTDWPKPHVASSPGIRIAQPITVLSLQKPQKCIGAPELGNKFLSRNVAYRQPAEWPPPAVVPLGSQ